MLTIKLIIMSEYYCIKIDTESVTLVQSALRNYIAMQMITGSKRLVIKSSTSTWFIENQGIELYLSKKIISKEFTKQFNSTIETLSENNDEPFSVIRYYIANESKNITGIPDNNVVYILQDIYKYNISKFFESYLIVTKQPIAVNNDFKTFEGLNESVYFVIHGELNQEAREILRTLQITLVTKNIHTENFNRLELVNKATKVNVMKMYLKSLKFTGFTKDTAIEEMLAENPKETKQYFVGGAVVNYNKEWLYKNVPSDNSCVLLKIDGIRTLMVILDNKEFYAITQGFHVLKFTDFEPKIKTPKNITILDGEFYNGTYYVFDTIINNKKDIRKLPLIERLKISEKIVKGFKNDSFKMNKAIFNDYEVPLDVTDFNPVFNTYTFVNDNRVLFDELMKIKGINAGNYRIKFNEFVKNIIDKILKGSELSYDFTGNYTELSMFYDNNIDTLNTIANEYDFNILSTITNVLGSIDNYFSIIENESSEINKKYTELTEGSPSEIFRYVWDHFNKTKKVPESLVLLYGATGLVMLLRNLFDPFYPWNDSNELLSYFPETFKNKYRDLILNADIENDGLIFMLTDDSYPTVAENGNYTWYSCQKWKPKEFMTIDLKVVFNQRKIENDSVNCVLFAARSGEDYKVNNTRLPVNNYNKTLPIAENSDTILPGSIVEFRIIDNKFIPVRVRYDKFIPNGLKNYDDIRNNLKDYTDLLQ